MANEISYKKITSGDILEKLKFAYCADPDNFIAAFAKLGIAINPNDIANDLNTLANFHNTGKDMDGSLKINNQSIRFNISTYVDSIPVRKSSINNCGMKLNFN